VIPFARYGETVQLPKKQGYPKDPQTVGEHIKKRRMDLGLRQCDISEQLGISLATMTVWENNHGEPQVNFYPKIIKFLGYMPLTIDTSTLGGKIKLYRYQHGLSHKNMARLLGVDASTIRSWEHNEHAPLSKFHQVLSNYIKQEPKK